MVSVIHNLVTCWKKTVQCFSTIFGFMCIINQRCSIGIVHVFVRQKVTFSFMSETRRVSVIVILIIDDRNIIIVYA
jgi:hypothetical protein